jgi:hypothetical protein
MERLIWNECKDFVTSKIPGVVTKQPRESFVKWLPTPPNEITHVLIGEDWQSEAVPWWLNFVNYILGSKWSSSIDTTALFVILIYKSNEMISLLYYYSHNMAIHT